MERINIPIDAFESLDAQKDLIMTQIGNLRVELTKLAGR